MDILPLNFQTCRMCGMWFESNSYYLSKMIYRLLVFLIIFQFTLSQIIELLTMHGSVDDFTEVLFLTLTFVALCLKVLNFVTRRSEMIDILDDFRTPICLAKSPEEKEIIQRCSKNTKKIFLSIMSLSQSTGLVLLVIPFLTSEIREIPLPFKSYQPYDVTDAINFWITYALQIFAAIYGVLLNVSMDTMVYGFIIMATGQFEINCYRLENSTSSMRDCIEHHVLIQDIVYKIQHFFICVVVPLFFFSLVTLCTSIFQMSQKQVASFEFLSLTMYLACMLCQVFLYCWFGNELELKSKAVANAIYCSTWTDFNRREKRNIWFIMLSAKNGLKISYHGQCSLSISTFAWIVKTSYASLNLLQQASSDK